MEHVAFLADLDGVAGVVAALEPHDDVHVAGEHVDKFALALVTPLGAYQNIHRHDP